jgi:hypothetical protein
MEHQEALQKAKQILALARVKPRHKPRNFLEYGKTVADAAKELSAGQRAELPWFADFALTWRKLYDDFDKIYRADPMILYEPAHDMARRYHASKAFIRWFCAGNRSSKTATGFAEHYYTLTGQHKWRDLPPAPLSSFIVGVDFQNYSKNVFEKKFLVGEDGSYITPIFPEGGKWLHHYDDRKHVIWLGCKQCANEGKSQSCRHQKSNLSLYSDESGWEVLQGAQFILGQLDEDVQGGYFSEAFTRLLTVPFSSLMVTGTPLFGPDAWQTKKLERLWKEGGVENLRYPTRKDSPLIVEKFLISMRDAGLVPKAEIDAFEKGLDEWERRARIHGEIVAIAQNPVFDKIALAEQTVSVPERCDLVFDIKPDEKVPELENLMPGQRFKMEHSPLGRLRVWEDPQPEVNYIAAVDSAMGLTDGDPSCCSILKVTKRGFKIALELVAQFHGHLNPHEYADEIMKIAVWYNSALVGVELTGGLGYAVVLKLKEYAYWNIYRDNNGPEMARPGLDSRLGIDTNQQSKPFMIGALQNFLKQRLLVIPCENTLAEMRAYEQERSPTGKTTQYRGTGGSHDDRVMSLAIAAAVAVSSPHLIDLTDFRVKPSKKEALQKLDQTWQDVHTEMTHQEDLAKQW